MDELISVTGDVDSHTLTSSGSLFSLPLRIKNLESDKDFHKFIKCVERLVRYSTEYKYWVGYLIEVLGVSKCALTHESVNETKVEIHHHPITLYVICKAVINSYIDRQEEFCTFDIAKDVIELHFSNRVGYMPIISDLHYKFHEGYLDLPMELVNGNYKYIIDTYDIEDNDLHKIVSLCNVSIEDCQPVWNKHSYPGLDDSNVSIKVAM